MIRTVQFNDLHLNTTLTKTHSNERSFNNLNISNIWTVYYEYVT